MKFIALLLVCALPITGFTATVKPLKNSVNFFKTRDSHKTFLEFVKGWKNHVGPFDSLKYEEFSRLDQASKLDDFIEYIKSYLVKIFGEQAADAIVSILGLEEVQTHILDMYQHIEAVIKNEDCEENMTLAFGDFVFIASTAAVVYYTHVPSFAIPGAAAAVGQFFFDKSGADSLACKAIHKEARW